MGVITGGKSSTRPPDTIRRPLRQRLPVIGDWPGQPWLWWFTMWYQLPGPIRASFDYSDLIVIVFAMTMLLLVFFLPFIPGLRSLPRWLRLYQVIWRPYYRRYGSSRKRRST